jgi:hypothetical protein
MFDEEETYPLILEGNTNGNHTDTFTVFIDWNKNGNFTDEGEMYLAGSIVNSTGTDGQQAITNITIPLGSTGNKRMRVIKQRTSTETPVWPQDPCGTYEYGQAEDYTLEVTHGDPHPCSIEYIGTLQDGLGNLQALQVANDFVINSTGTGNVYVSQLSANIFGNVTTGSIYIYNDNGGIPGTLLGSYEGLAPVSQTWVNTAFGFNVYNVVWELPAPIFAGADGETAWVGLSTTAGSEGVANYWETADITTGELAYVSNDEGNTWTVNEFGLDGAFLVWGICGEMGTTDAGPADFSYFPNPVKNILNINSEKKISKAEIYNSEGRQVFQTSNLKNGEINMRDLLPGIYLVRVKLENGEIETFKIIRK